MGISKVGINGEICKEGNCLSLPRILPIPIHSTQNMLFTHYLRVIYALLMYFLSLFFHLFYSLTSFYISCFYLLCRKRKKRFQKAEFEFERFGPPGSRNRRSETWKSCVSVKTDGVHFHYSLMDLASPTNSVLQLKTTFDVIPYTRRQSILGSH